MEQPKGKYLWTAKVGDKGQIVIPKEARDVFHIQPGDTLLLFGDEARGIAIAKYEAFTQLADAILKSQEPPKGEE